MRREVELSRKRSIKLKAQVDHLQRKQEGQGWSQHRERVTEEVLSVLRLLSPLTEPDPSRAEPSEGDNRLDAALAQLQNVARQLAMSHTTQVNRKLQGLIAHRVTREECLPTHSSEETVTSVVVIHLLSD